MPAALTAEKQKEFDNWLAGMEGKVDPATIAKVRDLYADPALQDYTATTAMAMSDFGRRGMRLNQELQNNEQLRVKLEENLARVRDYDQRLKEWEDYMDGNSVSRQEYEEAQSQVKLLTDYRNQVVRQLKDLELADLVDVPDPLAGQPGQPGQPAPASADPAHNPASNGGRRMQTNNNNNNQNPAPAESPRGRYISEMDLNKAVVEGTVGSVLGTAQLFELQNEYQQLTGKPLENVSGMVQEALKAGRPMMDYIREKLEFDKLRSEKSEKDLEAKIQARVQEELAKRQSEEKLPFGNRQAGQNLLSNTLREDPVAKGRPVQPGRPGEGARRATEKYLQGTYRGDNSGAGLI